MFPSTHDLLPEFLEPCVAVLKNLLEAGNRVLVVSKPHLVCITRICGDFAEYRDRVLFRFTIRALDNTLLAFWEPGAPTFAERLACLNLAYDGGFQRTDARRPQRSRPVP